MERYYSCTHEGAYNYPFTGVCMHSVVQNKIQITTTGMLLIDWRPRNTPVCFSLFHTMSLLEKHRMGQVLNDIAHSFPSVRLYLGTMHL